MNARPIRCLVTAGPTREFFDPVRFISNPSSGKMGYAIATAAAQQGWAVSLITGPVALASPAGMEVVRVVTGEEMYTETAARFPECDILIMSAAVSDYRPKQQATQKVKKHELGMTLEMEPTRDILKTLGWQKVKQVVVGFAAETTNVEHYAREKLAAKNCDYIVANQVGQAGAGFESDDNRILVIGRDGSQQVFGPAPKTALAEDLVQLLSDVLHSQRQ
ncbi:MAG: phosphopantothenoylcysteine decarboxylase [Verrucomicrobiota bacterium]|nr:phosphopantothenoylcysteine decarboxylase [Verrucomicrobiota bacterium]